MSNSFTVSEFFKDFPEARILGDGSRNFSKITSDSRQADGASLFIALKGEETDGHRFIPNVLAQGTGLVVAQEVAPGLESKAVWILTRDTKALFSQIVKKFFDYPERELKLIGITGTNGKTTSTFLIEHLLKGRGDSLLIGTVEYRLKGKRFPSLNTTPGIYDLTRLMREAADEGAKYAVMEISSHALKQRRLSDFTFETAVFSNLTQDHLDYHKTFEDYFASKKLLFTAHRPRHSVINQDDAYGRKLISELRALGREVVTYSVNEPSDSWASQIETDLKQTSFLWNFKGTKTQIVSNLICRHSVYNLLAALTALALEGIRPEELARALLSFPGVPGRMERVLGPEPFSVFVDYAHTPDAFLNVLSSVRQIHPPSRGKIITVFGAGGDRDKTKRPLMAQAAEEYSDRVVITSDNPRTEDPEKILDDVARGLRGSYERIPDRQKAIHAALEIADEKDVVLILGKGHEDYQIIGKEKIHFSDQEVVREWFKVRERV